MTQTCLEILFALATLAAPPTNDDFAAAEPLVSTAGKVESVSDEATAERSEPSHAGSPAAHSLWWTLTPDGSGVLALSTLGSSFDTVLAVYTGSRLDGLTEVASNDDGENSFGTESRLTIPVDAGTLYHLAVDGLHGERGLVKLAWHVGVEGQAEANDLFSARSVLAATSGRVVTSNRSAGFEPDEPSHADLPSGASLWWSWTAPSEGRIRFATECSNFDTVLAVYTGRALRTLEPVAADDDGGGNLSSQVSFELTVGTEYHIAVAGVGDDTGIMVLGWTFQPFCGPPGLSGLVDPPDGALDVALRPQLDWSDSRRRLQKVIYGEDGRREAFEIDDPALLEALDAVAVLVDRGDLTSGPGGTQTLSGPTYAESENLCSSERFADQPAPGWCTGFLVAPDLLVTAGHCLTGENCGDIAFVFDFRMLDAATPVLTFDAASVYHCAEIVTALNDGDDDWGIVRLDRPVSNRKPLRIRRSGKVGDRRPLTTLGHPGGIPAKVSLGARVRENLSPKYFVANIDAYVGNSGSPVLDADNLLVEGVLVSGEDDYVRRGDCNVSKTCRDDGCVGEAATRITELARLIPPHPDSVIYELHFGPCAQMVRVGELEEARWEPPELTPGTMYCWQVFARSECGSTNGPVWSFRTTEVLAGRFRRGEVTADGALDLSDPIAILAHLFLGEALASGCADSADVDDSGLLDLSDPIFLLVHLFLGGAPPPPPLDNCDEDPTKDGLDCSPAVCEG